MMMSDPEKTVEELKKEIFDAYGEATNGRYIDRWVNVTKILEDAVETYGEPEWDDE
jgi:hypothetical protein